MLMKVKAWNKILATLLILIMLTTQLSTQASASALESSDTVSETEEASTIDEETEDSISDTSSEEESQDNQKIIRTGGNAISTATFNWSSSMGDGNYSGYTLSGESLKIEPVQNTEQTVKLQITFALTNGYTADPGEIEIRIPQSIFYDSDGRPLVTCSLPLSTGDEGSTSFKYYIDNATGEIVITNYATFYSGSTFTCEVEYTFLPSDVEDGYIKDDIAASFNFSDSDTGIVENVDSGNLTVVVDTGADIRALLKSFNNKYETWQSSWGVEPVDSEDYFYIVWEVSCSTLGTESYTITFEDIPGQYGTVIGYSTWKSLYGLQDESEISQIVKKPSANGNSCTYYILVQYDRALLETEPEPTILNEITATLTEACGETKEKTATAKYTYKAVNFDYTGNQYSSNKKSTGDSIGMINIIENDKSGKLGVGSSSFNLSSTVQGWGLTQDDEGNYGVKKYTTEVIEGYRADGVTGSISIGNKILNQDDYEISSFYITYDEYDYEIDKDTGYKLSAVTDYSTYSPVEVYVRTVGDGGDWVLAGEILRTSSSKYIYTGINGTTTNSVGYLNQVQLPEGTYAVKFSHTSSRYQVNLEPKLSIVLNPTDNVKDILADKDSAQLYNYASVSVKDVDGSTNYSGNIYDYTMLTGLSPSSEIYKQYLGKESNADGYEILNYKVTMDEYVGYAPENIASDAATALEMVREMGVIAGQTEGVFYDLLPAGTAVDSSTINAVTYMNNEVCTYTMDTIENWQGSGQTMLIIKVTAPGNTNYNYFQQYSDLSKPAYLSSGFVLTYSLIYSWVDYHDYGGTLLNSVAYRAGSGSLAGGDTADNSTLAKKEYFADLDNDGQFDDQNEDTIYAQNSSQISAASAAEVGFTKAVKAADGLIYGKSAIASAAGTYTYRLRYANDNSVSSGTVSGLVLYDVLEVYGSGDNEQWKGTFVGVDTSYVENKGIDAVVYYSTISGLDPEENPGDEDLTDSLIWSTTQPDDLSTVTAIAIDLSKNTDGTDKAFALNEAALCYVTMRAPADYERWEGVYAYNSAHCKLTITSSTGDPITTLTESYPVKVELQGTDAEISKSSSPASGTEDLPTLVEVGDIIEYTITVKNTNTSTAMENVEITDKIPNGLTVDTSKIQFYIGSNAENAAAVSGAGSISVEQNAQTLVFTIDKLLAGETISFIIPTNVSSGGVFENTAAITKINGSEFEVNSETTYHKTDDPVGNVILTKLNHDETEALSGAAFDLYDSSGDLIGNYTTDTNGVIKVDNLTYGAYYFVETAAPTGYMLDSKPVEFTIDAVSTNSGSEEIKVKATNMKIANQPTVFRLTGTKELIGKTLEDDMFSFIVSDEAGNIVATAANKADGTITFSDISFAAEGTYTYTVSEVNGGVGGISYDDTEYKVTVKVEDNGDGTLKATASYPDGNIEFNNSYNTDSTTVTLIGTKKLAGKVLEDDMFSFVVSDEAGNIVATAANKADGTITFSDISFAAEGTYTYTVSEVNGGVGGISYDDTEYKVTVEAEDNGDGTLKATASYPDGNIEFNNSYSAGNTSTAVALTGTKKLAGKALEDNMFSFIATDENGKTAATGTNKADGTITFGEIGFTAPGTYTYTVTETAGTLSGITYDDIKYTVVIKVVDNGDGILSAEIIYPNEGVVFNNSYTANVKTNAKTNAKIINKTTSSGTSRVAKTGDDTVMMVYWMLLILSLFSVFALVYKSHGKSKK